MDSTSDDVLSWLDYAVFGLSLFLSLGTGIYHAVKSRLIVSKSGGKTSAKDEYLMGGREMPPLPVALSLLTTFLSGILMLGAPAEIFQRGMQWWMNLMVGVIASFCTALVFLPVFHKMKSTCLHEYFIYRYNSVLIRRLFSGIFLVFTLVYMSIVIYAPSVALAPVLNISKWSLILIFGLCTTLYTCIGGLKAVVWTDSLQSVLMYAGVFSLIFKSLSHPKIGGFIRVMEIAYESGRIGELNRFDLRIDQYNSFWINLTSGTITWISYWGVNQLAIQRYASLPTLKQAQGIIYYTLIPFIILCSIVSFIGLLMLAFYYDCNPIETGKVKEMDHVTIIFAKTILQDTPGLFGLYVSCIMSATLSTLSSGMNSMAAAVYEDFLKQRLDGKVTDSQAAQLNKGIVVATGLVATGLAFTAEQLGGVLRACINVMGAMSGPMVGIFVLAMFFPSSGFWSCFIAYAISNMIMVVICLSNYMQDPYKELFLPTNTTFTGCGHINFTVRTLPAYDAHFGNPNAWFISRISTYSYALVGFTIMMFIGIFINLVFKEEKPEKIRHLTFVGKDEPWPESAHELDHFLSE